MRVLTNPSPFPATAPPRTQSLASGVGTDGWNVISLRRNEPFHPSKREPIGSSPAEPDLPVVKPIPLVHVIEDSSDSMAFADGNEGESPANVAASNPAPPVERATTVEAMDRSAEHSAPGGEDIASAVFAAIDSADRTRDTSSASSSASAVERAFFQEQAEAESPLEKLWEHRSARILAMVIGVLIVAGGVAWVVGKPETTRLNTAVSLASASVPTVPKPTAPDQLLTMEPVSVSVQTPTETLEDGLELYNAGKAAEAAQILARVVQAQPSPTSWLMLGVARFDSGDNRGAEEAAVKALEMEPKNGRAMILRATIYLAAHQRQKAAEELKRYLKTDPDGPYAEEAKQLLSSW